MARRARAGSGRGGAQEAGAPEAAPTAPGPASSRRFRIVSGTTGSVLAEVDALSARGALDAMFNRVGDPAIEGMRSRVGEDPNDLIVTELPPGA